MLQIFDNYINQQSKTRLVLLVVLVLLFTFIYD